MVENDPLFQEKVKTAFQNVKKDINRLDNKIKTVGLDLNELKTNILDLKEEISKIIPYLEKGSPIQPPLQGKTSIGNEGVLNKQTNKQTIKQTNTKQINTLNELQEDIKDRFKYLTKQEFLTFLTIYQLEEELEIVRFTDIANGLRLSETCIRVYVSNLIEKNIPILKERINNKVVNLSLLPEFRKLDLKKALTNMYYNLDPLQKHLSDKY